MKLFGQSKFNKLMLCSDKLPTYSSSNVMNRGGKQDFQSCIFVTEQKLH